MYYRLNEAEKKIKITTTTAGVKDSLISLVVGGGNKQTQHKFYLKFEGPMECFSSKFLSYILQLGGGKNESKTFTFFYLEGLWSAPYYGQIQQSLIVTE